MNIKIATGIIGFFVATATTGVLAKEYTVGQKDKAFTTKTLVIHAGDTVKFENNDPYFHNVFSISGNKVFDLGSYPSGDSRVVVFEEPGTVEVECAIHADMYMEIKIK